ncbi:hypothetical protein CEQ20_06265 [Yersinia pseudotuberculosis]|nr:hypothetical protein CEQ20_06265 [Yersinia pseudotuberculosis]AYX12696.1 hypothetical protein EGX52_19060 [Yersinia pseudotuberculosis]PEI12631.1 hypothetical protein CRM78_04790 [Yersinia pseudotuberculosis]
MHKKFWISHISVPVTHFCVSYIFLYQLHAFVSTTYIVLCQLNRNAVWWPHSSSVDSKVARRSVSHKLAGFISYLAIGVSTRPVVAANLIAKEAKWQFYSPLLRT